MYEPKCKNVHKTCQVNHSERPSDPALNPWVICSREGSVDSAPCNCMSGLRENCTHIGTLLYSAKHATRLKETTTTTMEMTYWSIRRFKAQPGLFSMLSNDGLPVNKSDHNVKLNPICFVNHFSTKMRGIN